jgi:hypothetical protein
MQVKQLQHELERVQADIADGLDCKLSRNTADTIAKAFGT